MTSPFKKVEPSLSLNEVLEILGYQKSWLYSQIKLGEFPIPDRKIGKKNLWSREVIEQYLTFKSLKKTNKIEHIYNWSESATVTCSAKPCRMSFKY